MTARAASIVQRRSGKPLLTCYAFLLLGFLFPATPSAGQPRLAILNFNGQPEATEQIRELAAKGGFQLVETSMVEIAANAARYNGSLNLTTDEARALGLSIGCDYFLVGLARIQRRLLSEQESYFDILAAAFVVETRTGALLKFSFANARSPSEAPARSQLAGLVERVWTQSADAIKSPPSRSEAGLPQDLYDLDSKDASRLGIKPPQFFRRLKPQITESADLVGASATIELKVVFLASGQVGAIELLRWGGFGLDESAIATARQLRFEPARLQGRAVNVLAVVQYNFRKEERTK